MQVAGFDPIRDEGIAFAERLKEEGIPVELHVYGGLPHVFSGLFPMLSQSKEYVARQDAFLRKLASQ